MIRDVSRWFESKSFSVQIIVLALVLDPLGFVTTAYLTSTDLSYPRSTRSKRKYPIKTGTAHQTTSIASPKRFTAR